MRWLPYSRSRYLRTSSRKWGAIEGGSLRRCSPSGARLAASASSRLTYFSSAMRSRTWLRRWVARSGCSMGLWRAGLWAMPAMSAASGRVRSLTALPKKKRLAASTP